MARTARGSLPSSGPVTRSATVTVSGLRELLGAFDKLSFKTKRRVLERILMRRMEPIAVTAKVNAAPIYLWGDLERSIQVRTTPPHDAPPETRDPDSVNVYVGPGRNPQATLREFGTSRVPAHPYMRPAWDQHREDLPEGVAGDIAKEIATTADGAPKGRPQTS